MQVDSLPAERPGKPKNTGAHSLSPLQGELPDSGIESGSPALQVDSLLGELPGKPRNAGDPGSVPGSEDPLEKAMATDSSIPVWRIPWTEEPGEIQYMGSQRVRHD